MIGQAFLDELRLRISLVSVVGRRVKLAKRGREHEGLCPFHNEKSPSFTVNEDKGFYHCFGCGAHGDAVEFTMRTGGLSFRDAVEQLAAESGLQVPEEAPGERAQAARQASLLEALEAACALFERQLQGPAGREGLAYLRGRGLTDDTIARFRLGWAPGGDGLRGALPRDRFPDELLVEAGLLRERDGGGLVAMFRSRVMFPITDRRGRVIGFGGRVLGDEKPKYLNSPDTPVFRKGEVLYGLGLAKDGAAQAAKDGPAMAVVAEGYMDVLAMHQAALNFAVAPLGTALTEAQLGELWGMAPEPVLCLDGDKAGQRAMMRAAERALPLLQPGRSLRFAVMPEGEDPDSLIRQGGGDALRAVLAGADGLADVVWRSLVEEGRAPVTPEQMAGLERAAWAKAAGIGDHGVRRAWLGDFRRRLFLEAGPVPPPSLYLGRSKKVTAPAPRALQLAEEWAEALDLAGKTPALGKWLREKGLDLDQLAEQLGGVGLVRARLVKGRWAQEWDRTPRPDLYEPGTEAELVSLVVIPEWEGGPGGGLLDLVAWNPQTGGLASRAGAAVVLGEDWVAEALGLEANGLPQGVSLAASPLSWLRRVVDGEKPVLVVDWARAWDVLGGLSRVVAETEAYAEEVDSLLRPPRWRKPEVCFVTRGGANG